MIEIEEGVGEIQTTVKEEALAVEDLVLDSVEMEVVVIKLQSFVNYLCKENVPKVNKIAYIVIMPNRPKSWNCVNSIS